MGRIYVGDEVVVDPATKAPRTALWLDALATSGQSTVLPTPGNTLRPTQYLPLLKEPHNVRI
jgi:hypothetical protein